jgi:hypothetical protein
MPWPTPAACAKALAVTLAAVTLAGCAGGWRPHVRRYEAHEEATGSRIEVVPVARFSREAAPHDLVRPPAPSASRAAREPSPDRQPRRARPTGAPTASAGEVRYEPLSPAGGGAPSAVQPEVPAAPTRSSPGRLFVARGGAASPTPASPTPTVGPDVGPALGEGEDGEAEEDAHGHPEGAGDDEELAPDEVEEPLAPRDAPPPRGDGPRLADRRDPFYRPRVNADGIAAPYPPDRMFRGFGRCIRGTRHHHEGIDLGGIGPLWGLGTPIRSMARAEIVFIGRGDQNPELFGTPDLRRGTVKRGRSVLPRRAFVEGYGEVAFFTRRKGRWRSGNIIVTRGVEGPLKGHIIRYMHMGAIHPDMHPGRIVEAGEELALMGGTGVQESAPHLHLDIEAPGGHRVDVAPLVGLPPTASCEGVPTGLGDVDLAAATVPTANRYKHVPTHGEASARVATPPRPTSLAGRATGLRPPSGAGARASGRDDEEDDEEAEAGDDVGRVLFRRAEYGCAQKTFEEDFSSGRYDAHAYVVKLQRGEVLDVRLKGARGGWSGRLGAVGRGVSAKSSRGGITTVRASADTEVILKIEDARGGRPPKTASYSLALKGKCRGKATRPQRPPREPKARPAKAPRPKQGAPTRKPGRVGRGR